MSSRLRCSKECFGGLGDAYGEEPFLTCVLAYTTLGMHLIEWRGGGQYLCMIALNPMRGSYTFTFLDSFMLMRWVYVLLGLVTGSGSVIRVY